MKHRLRCKITDGFTRTAAAHISKGDLSNYSTDGLFIYKIITHQEYANAIMKGDNEPWRMVELDLDAEYDKLLKDDE